MNISLNEQLKKLRKEKGIKQDDLASHLGITVQAVSKWERGEGYPDITLLPAIAFYYNVSVDDLLGVGSIAKEQRIEEYFEKERPLFHDGKTKEMVTLWREAKKEFPNDLTVIYQLMYALQAEDRRANSDEIIEYGERILEESTDTELREGAIQSLCYTFYFGKGDAESAKKYANMAGCYPCTSNEMMPHLLEGEEAVQCCQGNIHALVDMIGGNTNTMIQKGGYKSEDAIKGYQFVLDCYELLYSDGNCGFYHCRLSEIYQIMAKYHQNLGNDKEMFACLENAAEHAVKYDTRKSGMYTAFMVNRLKDNVDGSCKDCQENDCGLLLNALRGEAYAQFENDERLQTIIEKIKPIASFGD